MRSIAVTFFVLFATLAFSQQINPVVEAILETSLGFLSASGVLSNIEDFPSCIFEAQTLTTAIPQLLADLKTHNASSIAQAISIYQKDILPAAQVCGAAGTEGIAVAKDIISKLSNKDFDEAGLSRLLNNSQEVLGSLAEAYGDFSQKQWVSFGSALGDIVGLFFNIQQDAYFVGQAESILAGIQYKTQNISVLVQILSGFADGLNIDANATDLPTCSGTIYNVTLIVEAAEQLYNNGSIIDIEKALVLIGDAMQYLGIAEYVCQKSYIEIQDYLQQFEIDFSNSDLDIRAIGQMIRDATTYNDIKAIINAFESDNWFQFGENLGQFISFVHEEVLEQVPFVTLNS